MEVASVITLGEPEVMKHEKTEVFSMAGSITVDEDLDFEKIRETAKRVQKEKQIGTTAAALTASEKRAIPIYIKDMIAYIKKYASQGKMKFEYDCEKLTPICFNELATQFKQKYPMFFVLVHSKDQTVVIDWTGKHEV